MYRNLLFTIPDPFLTAVTRLTWMDTLTAPDQLRKLEIRLYVFGKFKTVPPLMQNTFLENLSCTAGGGMHLLVFLLTEQALIY